MFSWQYLFLLKLQVTVVCFNDVLLRCTEFVVRANNNKNANRGLDVAG